jgi:serine/threonine protein kinase
MNEKKIGYAVTKSGKRLPYVITENPPRGGMKYTYFAPDKSYVIQFYNKPADADASVKSRIEAIIGKYNPSKTEAEGGAVGTDKKLADYYKNRYAWIGDTVVSPEYGLVSPAYPKDFFFSSDASDFLELEGKDKKSNWFTGGNRRFLKKEELGDLRTWIQMSLLLARSVRRLHQAGLAHSDLSNNNVLIDPKSGNCIVIDIDGLVVPGIYPPEVAGTRGYIAPEVLATFERSASDPRRMTPNAKTDLHALAVLIYEYLFFRHPLIGPKIHSTVSAEEDDRLALGERAVFIEDPKDTSNRPKNLFPTIEELGPILSNLFLRAFSDGLHSPALRPSAMEWERGLSRTWDLLHKCNNKHCTRGWFVFYDPERLECPYCGMKIREDETVRLWIYAEVRGHTGQWRKNFEIDITDNTPLFSWHTKRDVFPDEKADRTLSAYIVKNRGEWYLINSHIEGLISPGGKTVSSGNALKLFDGAIVKTDGVVMKFSISKNGKSNLQ